MAKPLATDTDSDGRFHFDNLPPGNYRIDAAKPGVVLVDRRGGDPRAAIDVATGQFVSVDLVFEQGAALEGRVVTDSGEPASNVVVSALRARADSGGTRPIVRQVKTDDRGLFRLHTLIADEYIVEAAPGTARTYYPGSARPEDASRLTVSAGQEVRGLEFSLTSAPSSAVPARAPVDPGRQVGRAYIAGVVSAVAGGRPVRGADVALIRWEGGSGTQTHVATDTQGRFEFSGLTAGSYQLTVRADGYAARDYGQRWPGEPGNRIALADAQAFDKADVALLRTGAIDGRILDEFGDPAPGILVQLARVEFAAGKTRLMPIGGTNQTRPTDDLGQFRAFGLPQGDYYVEALSGPFAGEDRAGFAPTFYPGVTVPRDAQPVHVGVGQDVPTLVFQLAASPLATISGRTTDTAGQPVRVTRLWLLQTYADDVRALIVAIGSANPDGVFQFRNVPAGTYVVQALHSAGAGSGDVSFGAAPITVGGTGLNGVAVTLAGGATARGRITFEGAVPPPPRDSIRIIVRAVDFASSPAMGIGLPPSHVNDDGTFEATRNFGRGVLRVDAPSPWGLERITLNGVDVTDAALDFRGRDVDGLEMILTARTASLSGRVLDENRAVTDGSVIVFADDSTKWGFPSRYVTLARPNQDGFFTTQPLPPGRYLAVAIPVAGTDWSDPQFLESLRRVATPLVLDGETLTRDLTLVRR